MKKIQMSAFAIAALVGVTGAFAFGPKVSSNLVYAQPDGSGGFVYTDVQPDPLVAVCNTDASNVACTISATINTTASYFNSNYSASFPTTSDTRVVSLIDQGKIYK